MKNGLAMCAVHLQEVEEKLVALQASLGGNFSERTKVSEALSFIAQARKAISETQVKVDSLLSGQTE